MAKAATYAYVPVDDDSAFCFSVLTLSCFTSTLLIRDKEVSVRLPKLIYEAYPVLYILGGIATMSMVGSTVAFCSGFLLGLSGTIILFLRRNYRAIRQHLYT